MMRPASMAQSLSAFYFFYFAILGALLPYWSLYLKDLGYQAAAIGSLLAILQGTKLFAPYMWGWLADHYGRRMLWVRLGAVGATFCFAGLLLGSSYYWLALVTASFSFFWNAALPQLEVVTFNHLGLERSPRYGWIRLWGSVGFIWAVVGLGKFFGHYSSSWLPWLVLSLFVFMTMTTWWVNEGNEQGQPSIEPVHLRALLGTRPVVVLFVVCFLTQVNHGPYYALYSLYMEQLGFSRPVIGNLWAFAVICEIAVFLCMGPLFQRFSAVSLMIWTQLLTALRWWLLAAYAEHDWVIWLAQALHMISFGLYHAVAVYMTHRLFTGRNQGRGQALYSSISFGAGGALGAWAAGELWAPLGGAGVFMGAAMVALLAALITWLGFAGVKAKHQF